MSINGARPYLHPVGRSWFVNETYVKFADASLTTKQCTNNHVARAHVQLKERLGPMGGLEHHRTESSTVPLGPERFGLRRDAFDVPGAVAVDVTQAVVEPTGSALPKLEHDRRYAVAAPERRASYIAFAEAGLHIEHPRCACPRSTQGASRPDGRTRTPPNRIFYGPARS